MVIVKSKLTGKFLRQHSDSANSFRRRKYYQVLEDKEFMASLPKTRRSHNHWIDPVTPGQKAINRETHDRMYDADAMEARRYTSAGSALSSIGKWIGSGLAPEARKGIEKRKAQHVLPEYLEIHEIVAGNLCLVNSDDDEETKRRKKEDCT